jgi:hypothetical protein
MATQISNNVNGVIHEEEFKLTQAESGMSSRDIGPDSNKDQWQDFWRFQVPVGQALIFQSHHWLAMYSTYVVDGLDLFLLDDGGSFSDDTTDANDAGAGDIALMPGTEAVNDAAYIGMHYPFGRVGFDLGTAGVGNTITWEYYNGSWTTIPNSTDATTGLTSSGEFSFQPPDDWARTTADGKEAFWIRARVSAASYSTVPVGDTIYINGTSAGAAVAIGNYERFRIEVRDASENQRYPLINQTRYEQMNDFRDRTLRYYLPLNDPVIAKENMWVIIQSRPASGILDVSASYFELSCRRIRKGIYA